MKNNLLNTGLLLLSSLVLLSMAYVRKDFQDEWKVPAKYEKMENPYAKATDAEQLGKVLYAKHCKSCHGTKGHGDGTKASSLDTEVPDFATDAFKKQTDGSLYYKTIFGKDDMPSFEKKIVDEEERWFVINYMRTL